MQGAGVLVGVLSALQQEADCASCTAHGSRCSVVPSSSTAASTNCACLLPLLLLLFGFWQWAYYWVTAQLACHKVC